MLEWRLWSSLACYYFEDETACYRRFLVIEGTGTFVPTKSLAGITPGLSEQAAVSWTEGRRCLLEHRYGAAGEIIIGGDNLQPAVADQLGQHRRGTAQQSGLDLGVGLDRCL